MAVGSADPAANPRPAQCEQSLRVRGVISKRRRPAHPQHHTVTGQYPFDRSIAIHPTLAVVGFWTRSSGRTGCRHPFPLRL